MRDLRGRKRREERKERRDGREDGERMFEYHFI